MVFALSLLFLLGCEVEKKSSSSLLDYIPENSAVIIKINDLDKFKNVLEENDFLEQFEKSGISESITDKTKDLKYISCNSESVIAFSELGKDQFEFVFVAQNFPKLINVESESNKIIESIIYEGQTIENYTVNNSAFFAIKIEGKFILSSSQALIEKIVQNAIQTSVPKDLKRLYEMTDKSKEAFVFLDLAKCNSLTKLLLAASSKLKVSNFSDWVSLDISTDKDRLQLNGVTVANDSLKNYVNLFRNTNPLVNVTPSYAPISSEAIVSCTFDNYKEFSKNQQKYLDRTTPMDSLFNSVEEIGFIYESGQKLVLLNTFGTENISAFLEGIKKVDYMYQGNVILELGSTDFLKNSLYPIIDEFTPNFCTILDNAFLFAETKGPLETVISNYKNGSSFEKSSIYISARESLASESSFLFISDDRGVENLLSPDFDQEFIKDFKDAKFDKFAFGTQFIADEDFFHFNTVIQKTEKETRAVSVSPLFSTELDNELATDPQFVINHNTNKKEIVVQDVGNVLYLISTEGTILWKKQLAGSIQGKIEQVDILRNGRLQMAFTTNNQFLILDRNGEEVKPFSFTYESGNVNPLAVFDYEGKKEYRFVVSQGEKIFMYNNKGDIVDGFKYKRAEKPVIGAPKHFVIGKKDYLVFKLEDGTLKILNRVGDVRTKVGKQIDFSENEVYVYKNKFTVTDKKGVLYQIDPNGKIMETRLNLNKDHRYDATNNTLVYMNDNTLDIKGKKVDLDLGVYTSPKIFYLYDKIYVGVTDIQNQNTYLFDSQAKSISNFPVFGNSSLDLADIDNDRKLELVVKSQNNSIVVYKLN